MCPNLIEHLLIGARAAVVGRGRRRSHDAGCRRLAGWRCRCCCCCCCRCRLRDRQQDRQTAHRLRRLRRQICRLRPFARCWRRLCRCCCRCRCHCCLFRTAYLCLRLCRRRLLLVVLREINDARRDRCPSWRLPSSSWAPAAPPRPPFLLTMLVCCVLLASMVCARVLLSGGVVWCVGDSDADSATRCEIAAEALRRRRIQKSEPAAASG